MANLSKQKRDKLLKYIDVLKQEHHDDTNIRLLNKLELALTEKKYGLMWEAHSEQVDEKLVDNIPIFLEDEKKKISANQKNSFNFLIEGDNLHSLILLQKTHADSIDLIYIDPPYNTGNDDFIYDDSFVGEDDAYRHSKWLSFMEKRLLLAKELLSIDGSIFVSIGDDELAQLKLLMDEIFGHENFINLVSVKTKNAAGASGGGEDKKLKKNLEYLLIYTKRIDYITPYNTVYSYTEIEDLLEYYKENDISWKYTSVIVDYGEKKYVGSTLDGGGEEIKIYERIGAKFKSVNRIAKDDGISVREVYNRFFDRIHTTAMPQSSIRKRVLSYIGEENLSRESVYSIEYVPVTGRNKGKMYEQFYKGQKLRLFAWFKDVGLKEDDGTVFKKDIAGTYWDGIELNNLSKEGNVVFNNGKKPLSLLNRIISMIPYNDITVLDFFAGSGTTGHAVMQINKEDGGDRKYILCTNNENNICEEKTYKRLTNIQNELPHNLKYLKTEFIPKSEDEETILSTELLRGIKELVELENMTEIDDKDKLLLIADEDLTKLTEANEGATVYISTHVLLSRDDENIISSKKITKVDIPDYYYLDELVEGGER